mgnify:CR=1 FL=1
MKLSKILSMLTRRSTSSSVEPPPSSDLATLVEPQEPQPLIVKPSVIDLYIRSAPNPQNALDIFEGEWSSALSEPFSHLRTGAARLFDDGRIYWFAEAIGGVVNKSVLELGSLEAGHTCMLEKLGAASIVAIESNTHAFLKSLIIKELYELKRAHFLCGDFIAFLQQEDTHNYQVCLASGVLYHMQNPVELIALLTRRCLEHLLIWTHYYDETIISGNPSLSPKFTDSTQSEYEGFQHTLYRQEYQAALAWNGFCGGNAPSSCWMTRTNIIQCLEHFGFEVQGINFEDPKHPNGPAFALIAKRRHNV